jgi:hypothetical protein
VLDRVIEGKTELYFILNTTYVVYKMSGDMSTATLAYSSNLRTDCQTLSWYFVNPASGSLIYRCDESAGVFRAAVIKNNARTFIPSFFTSSSTTIREELANRRNNYNRINYKGKEIIIMLEADGVSRSFGVMNSSDQLSPLVISPTVRVRADSFSLIDDQLYFSGSGMADNLYQLYKYYEP